MVDGCALPCCAKRRIPRSKFRDWAPTSELRRDGAVRSCLLLDRVDVATDPRIALKVAGDEGLRGIARDARTCGQTKVAHAVGDAEVDHLRHGALIGVHVGGWLPEHAGGGRTVNILSGGEGGDQVLVAGDVRQDAQLDLAIVRRHQGVPLLGNEGVADLAAEGGANWDVLQVWIGGAESPRCRHRLLEGGVHTAVTLNELRQRLDVGALQLRHGAPLHGDPNDRMLPLDLLQHACIGRPGTRLCLLPLRQVELHKEEFAELLRRAERNGVTDGALGLPLEARDLCGECCAQLAQRRLIHGDPGDLHARKYLNEGELNLAIEAEGAGLAQLFGEGAA